MDELDNLIINLDRLNKAILFSLDERQLEVQRSKCISKIDNICKVIEPNDRFIDLIKKYLTVQEEYKIKKK